MDDRVGTGRTLARAYGFLFGHIADVIGLGWLAAVFYGASIYYLIHKLVDDLDGGDAEQTVKFALDGIQYEIDLSDKNAQKLRDVFAPYVASGAKVARGGVVVGGRAARGRGGATADREQNKAIREWAKKSGKDISDRGRIPQEIVDEFHAHGPGR